MPSSTRDGADLKDTDEVTSDHTDDSPNIKKAKKLLTYLGKKTPVLPTVLETIDDSLDDIRVMRSGLQINDPLDGPNAKPNPTKAFCVPVQPLGNGFSFRETLIVSMADILRQGTESTRYYIARPSELEVIIRRATMKCLTLCIPRNEKINIKADFDRLLQEKVTVDKKVTEVLSPLSPTTIKFNEKKIGPVFLDALWLLSMNLTEGDREFSDRLVDKKYVKSTARLRLKTIPASTIIFALYMIGVAVSGILALCAPPHSILIWFASHAQLLFMSHFSVMVAIAHLSLATLSFFLYLYYTHTTHRCEGTLTAVANDADADAIEAINDRRTALYNSQQRKITMIKPRGKISRRERRILRFRGGYELLSEFYENNPGLRFAITAMIGSLPKPHENRALLEDNATLKGKTLNDILNEYVTCITKLATLCRTCHADETIPKDQLTDIPTPESIEQPALAFAEKNGLTIGPELRDLARETAQAENTVEGGGARARAQSPRTTNPPLPALNAVVTATTQLQDGDNSSNPYLLTSTATSDDETDPDTDPEMNTDTQDEAADYNKEPDSANGTSIEASGSPSGDGTPQRAQHNSLQASDADYVFSQLSKEATASTTGIQTVERGSSDSSDQTLASIEGDAATPKAHSRLNSESTTREESPDLATKQTEMPVNGRLEAGHEAAGGGAIGTITLPNNQPDNTVFAITEQFLEKLPELNKTQKYTTDTHPTNGGLDDSGSGEGILHQADDAGDLETNADLPPRNRRGRPSVDSACGGSIDIGNPRHNRMFAGPSLGCSGGASATSVDADALTNQPNPPSGGQKKKAVSPTDKAVSPTDSGTFSCTPKSMHGFSPPVIDQTIPEEDNVDAPVPAHQRPFGNHLTEPSAADNGEPAEQPDPDDRSTTSPTPPESPKSRRTARTARAASVPPRPTSPFTPPGSPSCRRPLEAVKRNLPRRRSSSICLSEIEAFRHRDLSGQENPLFSCKP